MDYLDSSVNELLEYFLGGLLSLKKGLRVARFLLTKEIQCFSGKMGNIESVDGQGEMKHHIMPLKVPMPDPTELEEKFAIVLVSCDRLRLSL